MTHRASQWRTPRASRGIVNPATEAGELHDVQRLEAVADALHNVPRLLREGQNRGWTVAGFRELFLAPLVERYPDLAGLDQPVAEND